ncbi:MAG TPA: O-antigen ligase family protein [Gaiellaceae bacterium]|nr:O-antigen ligase family protein [Gaiellaceae bacterium]
MTADLRRPRFDAGRVGVGLGLTLGLALIAFSSGGYFSTGWAWGALVSLVVVAALLVLGTALRPSPLGLVSLGGLAGFGVWTWLALLWSDDAAATALEGQRVLLYVSAFAALLIVVRRATVPVVLAATFTAIFLASAYGLLTKLFPERLGVYDPVAAHRLEEPLTYWNALGVFAVMGALLGLGFATRAQTLAVRVLSAASLPLLFATVYFTFSRGAWIAGAVGLAAAIAVDPRRLQLLAGALVLAAPSSLAVLISSQQEALTRTDVLDPSDASHDGQRLAVYLLLLAGASALTGALFWRAGRAVAPSRQARLLFAGVLAFAAAAALLAVFVRYGGPVTLAQKGYDSFTTTSGETPVNLNRRLFTFSGSYRSELWHAAWQDYEANPLLGSGPGTYEQYWNAHRPIQHKVRDAHSLYLEVLAELGPVGLALLLVALGAPLVAGAVARGSPLVPAAFAAYAAYLAHASVDWDWEMGAVTLAALAVAAALVAAADRRESPPLLSLRLRAGGVIAALVLLVVAFVGVVGSSALAASDRALAKGKYGEASSQARKASDWWWWSPDPWRQLGDVAAEQGDNEAARDNYRKAIAKDESDWRLWYDLSTVTTGEESRQALAEATRLNRYASSDFDEVGDVPR